MSETPPEQPPKNADLRTRLETEARTHVDVLLATIAVLNTITARTNAEINANPAATIKDVAREVKTVARQTVRLTLLAVDKFDDADTGS